MIQEEPIKVAVWHALNTYCYEDAIFLAERLYAEVKNEELLHLLATTYHRSGNTKRAYYLLKNSTFTSNHNKYLFSVVCYKLEKLREAEISLTGTYNPTAPKSPTVIANEYGSLAGAVLQLLANIYRKLDCLTKAATHYKQSLRCNPFLWMSFENLCQIGEKVDPDDYFKRSNDFKASTQHYSCSLSFSLPQPVVSPLNPLPQYDNTPSENQDPTKALPLLTSTVIKPVKGQLGNKTNNSDINMPPPPIPPMGGGKNARQRILRSQISESPVTPSFGIIQQLDSPWDAGASPLFITPPISTLASKIPTKAPLKAPKKIPNKHPQSTQKSLNISGSPSSIATPSQSPEGMNYGLRRSSRLFGSSSTSRDIKRTPRVKFDDNVKVATPGKKTKSRLNRPATTNPLTPTSQNIQTTTSSISKSTQKINKELYEKEEKPSMPSPIQQSTDGLMKLLVSIGKAYQALAFYDCKRAIELFDNLPLHQLSTSRLMEKLAISYYECGENTLAEKAFDKVRELDPYYIEEGMAIYSSLLWLTRKDMKLSSLAQDLVDHDKFSHISWSAMGNCYSLQKEHDLAIKFLERAIQIKPDFSYGYTLLGHEYTFTDENERALSFFRSAIRHNERHYNAWYGIGMIYYRQERYTLAEHHYQKALSINPKHSVLLCNLAVTQNELGRSSAALESLDKAIQLNPKNALCKYHKASILLAKGRPQDALDILEEVKKIESKDSLVFYMIGKVYQQLNEPHLAQMNFSWAMDLDPQGTNTMIKEAMSQQRFASLEEDEFDGEDDEMMDEDTNEQTVDDELRMFDQE